MSGTLFPLSSKHKKHLPVLFVFPLMDLTNATHVHGVWTLRTLTNLELNLVSFAKIIKRNSNESVYVEEKILFSTFTSDKSVPVIQTSDSSCFHLF